MIVRELSLIKSFSVIHCYSRLSQCWCRIERPRKKCEVFTFNATISIGIIRPNTCTLVISTPYRWLYWGNKILLQTHHDQWSSCCKCKQTRTRRCQNRYRNLDSLVAEIEKMLHGNPKTKWNRYLPESKT